MSFLGANACLTVSEVNAELLCTAANNLTSAHRASVCNFYSEFLCVHHEHVKLTSVENTEFILTIRKTVTSNLGASVTNLRHKNSTTILPASSVINTTGLSPARLKKEARRYVEQKSELGIQSVVIVIQSIANSSNINSLELV